MKFERNNILLDVEAKDKLELFNIIADYALEHDIAKDRGELVNAFLAREAEVSTGLQDSFAIPHAKSEIIKAPTVLFLKLKSPIEWETFDGKPVSNVFALLVPTKYEGTVHLEMISKIATSLLEDEFVQSVKNSFDIDELYKQIGQRMYS